jgi:hypothetical protein
LVHLHISNLYCAKAKTNMFPWASRVLSLRLKGKWSIWQRHRFPSTSSVLSFLAGIPPSLQIWYNLHSYIVCQRGRESKRAHISLTSIRFWRFMPKGEKVLAQSKRTAPPPISKNVFFQFVFKKFFKLVSYIWYNFKLVWPPSKLISKTLLTLRGEFHWGGVLFKSKEKHLKQGRKFQILKMLLEILFITFDYLQKDIEKEFPKDFAKTKHVVQAWSKMLN